MKKILVVDDDRVTLTMLQMILVKGGFEVITAKDGEEGYELVQDEIPNLLISDMLIPKVDGLELCKRIKENPDLKHIKVILMSGVYKGVTFKFEAKDVGAEDFVEKPFNTDDLLRRIEFLIGGGKRKTEQAEEPEDNSD